MGALASLWLELAPGAALGALGGSYFSETVAARGVGSPWDGVIQDAALESALDPALVQAVIAAESAWNPNAVSADGTSWGLMQLNVQAHELATAQALDPTWAIPYGARLLAGQLARRPSLRLALAAYNAGTSRTDADLAARMAADRLGVGTYVETVLTYLAWYQQQTPAPGPVAEILPEPTEPFEPASGAPAGEGVPGPALGVDRPSAWFWGILAGAGVLVLGLMAWRARGAAW